MRSAIALAILMSLSWAAIGQEKSREAEQLRRLRQQAQQLQQQLAAEQQKSLQAQTEAQKAKDGANAQIERIEDELRITRSRGQGAQAQAERLRNELDQLTAAHAELSRRFDAMQTVLDERTRVASETMQRLQQRDSELSGTKNQLSETQTELKQCTSRNAALFELGNEVIDRFEKRTLGERVGQGEPFFQTGRVQLENLAEGYRDRLYEQAPVSSGFYGTQ